MNEDNKSNEEVEKVEAVEEETQKIKPIPELKTLLIFGISSVLGGNLAEFLKKDFKVVGTYHKTPVNIPGVLSLPCDVLKKEEVQLVLYSTKPDITFYCIGYNSLTDCAQYEELADALNTSGLIAVADMCQRYKSQICYISSEYVFSGENKEFSEMDIPDPGTAFGKTKVAGEFFVQKNSLNYMIYRCCHLYGRHVNPQKKSFFEKMQHNLVSPSSDVYDNYVYHGWLDINYLCMIIKICLEKKASNRIVQITSTDYLTTYKFVKKYCEVFQESSNRAAKGRWNFPAAKSFDSMNDENFYFKMNPNNLESFLNIDMPTVEESLKFTLRRFKGSVDQQKRKKRGGDIVYI